MLGERGLELKETIVGGIYVFYIGVKVGGGTGPEKDPVGGAEGRCKTEVWGGHFWIKVQGL